MRAVERSLIFLLVASVALVTGQQKLEPNKDDNKAAQRYRQSEPPFSPPPLPIQRQVQVVSEPEQPPSFFPKPDKIESRQFEVQQQQPPQFQQQSNFPQQQIQQPQPNFQSQQQSQQRQQAQVQFQFQQQPQPNQQPLPNQQPEPNQQPQQQPEQNFQQFQQQQSFQNFDDQNNFQSRQQETFPTLPPVFIPPNQPIGPAPALQSPIRNLFREPEPSFSLTGLLQRFLRLFNLGNNN